MYGTNYYQHDDPMATYQQMLQRGGSRSITRRFDEYYRCYPVTMFRGPERDDLEYGGKILMPPSALEKLTRLHITYPMLFELINGQLGKTTHCGVLEFTAEEGKLYLPHWMMQTLLLETGDLIQIKSTDLPSAALVKLQPQSTNFLDISDPKAVLEKAFRNFATLTKGDIFCFKYNDTIYSVGVLEVKPETDKMGVSMLETDVSVDFAPPVGYVEPQPMRNPGGLILPGSSAGGTSGQSGTMAKTINYSPNKSSDNPSTQESNSNFRLGGHKLNGKKVTNNSTKSTSAPNTAVNQAMHTTNIQRTDAPSPLRLPPNQIFLGFEIKPLKAKADKDQEKSLSKQPHFEGKGNTLRSGKRK
ncbi:unnamed protein product [Blumeria hordei]|uniref:Ubiquitin fusion degradation protein 1 n=1 Tax=Blumeria hordei TaxID=2867405 RepID=A0A383UU85_BLUHO|nr:unnamed protein product [Blumeria hordei]